MQYIDIYYISWHGLRKYPEVLAGSTQLPEASPVATLNIHICTVYSVY